MSRLGAAPQMSSKCPRRGWACRARGTPVGGRGDNVNATCGQSTPGGFITHMNCGTRVAAKRTCRPPHTHRARRADLQRDSQAVHHLRHRTRASPGLARLDRAQIQRPPPPPTLPGVITRTTPPAHPAAPTLSPPRSNMGHQQARTLIDLDPLDRGPLDPEQTSPYPPTAHVVPRP
jgi:hypothetical protein